jgi:transcriptional regulator with GAF, ATPase, and Fis domain
LESELFGYVKGSFTGANANRKGLFEAAHKGTIFLDEIGEMSPAMQVKLLRVLQERKVRPVGAHDEMPIDARVFAATNRDLKQMSADGSFREDLFYRISVIPIHLPPLREEAKTFPNWSHISLKNLASRRAEGFHSQKAMQFWKIRLARQRPRTRTHD